MSHKNIMIIEDEEMYSIFLTHYLQNNLGDPNINVYTTGREGLDRLANAPHDLLILDYYLEDTNGLEVLKEAKRIQPDIVVIVLSANKKIETAVELLKEGATTYLEKSPDSANELIQAIERAFEAKELDNRTLTVSLNLKKNKTLRWVLIGVGVLLAALLVINLTNGL